MLKIKLLISILFFTIISTNAQKKVNDYKYIIVPSQFEFQQNAGDYDINEMTKFLFNKYGFNALLSTEVFPKDLGENRCLALTAHLRKKSTFFTTKMKYELVNCYNEVVYTSLESASKNKEYGRAYQEAINKTFKSIQLLNYQYSEPENIVVDEKVEIKEEIESIDEEKLEVTEEVSINKILENKSPNLGIITTKKENKTVSSPIVKKDLNLLYAIPVKNGFQLIDGDTKKVYLIIKETSVKDVFILEDKNGILYRLGEYWIAEYYDFNQPVEMRLSIEFQ